MLEKISAFLNIEKLIEYGLIIGYFISLFSATCFFFDTRAAEIFGVTVQLPIGLIFFPLTFAFSNIIQDRYGRLTANSLIFTAFIGDTLLVFGGVFLAFIGDRQDYWTVFSDMPYIMISTWFFLGIGAVFNIGLYSYLKRKSANNLQQLLFRFFLTITATEALTSLMSMPLMFYRHGLVGSVILTTALVVMYKVTANVVITLSYGVMVKKQDLNFPQLS